MTTRHKPAIEGGTPVRRTLLSYGGQWIDEDDVEAVVEALRSDWLTTGPRVEKFEKEFAKAVGARHAVAVNSGTAALHSAVRALGLGAGDEVIVPAITFAATANAALFEGARPVIADVDPDTLLLDLADAEERITPRTKAIISVDYAGQPQDYDELAALAQRRGLVFIADSCHALGASYKGRAVGSLASLSTFSFHPVKPMTTAEGGMITTDDAAMAETMRSFRNHCMDSDFRRRESEASWFYEVTGLGFNYRLSDVASALGASQLKKLIPWTERRCELALRYDEAFDSMSGVRPLTLRPERTHAYHLYVVQLELERLTGDRGEIFAALRAEGIGVNVHYVPLHLQKYYQETLGVKPGLCPNAEAAYERILTLPLYARMSDADAGDVIAAVEKVIEAYLA